MSDPLIIKRRALGTIASAEDYDTLINTVEEKDSLIKDLEEEVSELKYKNSCQRIQFSERLSDAKNLLRPEIYNEVVEDVDHRIVQTAESAFSFHLQALKYLTEAAGRMIEESGLGGYTIEELPTTHSYQKLEPSALGKLDDFAINLEGMIIESSRVIRETCDEIESTFYQILEPNEHDQPPSSEDLADRVDDLVKTVCDRLGLIPPPEPSRDALRSGNKDLLDILSYLSNYLLNELDRKTETDS